jgi:hypothetical protein
MIFSVPVRSAASSSKEREAEIQPHGMTDDLGAELVAGVAGASGWRHPTRLLTRARRSKHGKPCQVGGATTRTVLILSLHVRTFMSSCQECLDTGEVWFDEKHA